MVKYTAKRLYFKYDSIVQKFIAIKLVINIHQSNENLSGCKFEVD